MYTGYDTYFMERLFDFIKYPEFISPSQIIYESLVYILAAICIYHGFKTFGRWKTLLFFFGSFFYTGFEENIMIISGKIFSDPVIPGFPETYAFNYTNYTLWILAVPLVVYVAWFVVAYSAVHIATYIFKSGIVKQAALGGLIAMEMDMMIDPIAVRYSWWGWFAGEHDAIWILGQPGYDFGIPISNFLGWFLLIFLFAIYWKKITDKESKWGVRKTIIVFSLGLIPFLIATVIVVGGLTILVSGLNGVYFPIPFGG